MYLIYSLKNILDVLDRFIWKICWEWSAECLQALLTKSAFIFFTIITRMMVCMLRMGFGGWAECGTGQPTHHSQKYWQQLLFGSNQSPAPYCPFTLPLSTCNLCFCIWVFVFVCVCIFFRSNQSYPSLPICSFSMDKDIVRSILFLSLSDLENYICFTFLRFTWVSWSFFKEGIGACISINSCILASTAIIVWTSNHHF